MEIMIIEGARGTGKTTVASKIRQTVSEMTLINPTGFHEDGVKGLAKINQYYDSWLNMLYVMHEHDSTVLFDRFYFSEAVYSKLYKNYSFAESLKYFNADLDYLAKKGVKIDIFFLTIDDEKELSNRLIRDKVPFGKAEESVKATLLQQSEYSKVLTDFKEFHSNENLRLHTVKTDGKTTDDVYNEILKLKATL